MRMMSTKVERLTERLSTPQPVSEWVKPHVGQTVYFQDKHGDVIRGELWAQAPIKARGSDPWWVWVAPDDVRLVVCRGKRNTTRYEDKFTRYFYTA